MSAADPVRFEVSAQLDGARLDRALSARFDGWSRSRLQSLVREGRVRLRGEVQRKSGARVEAGDEVSVELPGAPVEVAAEEARRTLPLVHVDEAIVVVDKPAGLLAHRGEGALEPSVSELCAALFGSLPSIQGADRPGIVHRLDRETSGVMVLGRTPEALEELVRQFRAREVEKEYLALVHGEPRFESDWIEKPLGRAPRHPDRISVRPEGEGREARTYYEVAERFPGFTLFTCRPLTGRTHQVRVHLASIEHPVVGDRVYRRRGKQEVSLPAEAEPPARHMLHARRLSFRHPASGARVAFEAPLPEDFRALLEALRRTA